MQHAFNLNHATDREKGAHAENLITHLLTQKGFTILARNFKHRGGELDIVAQHHDLIIIVEVKMRSNSIMPIADLVPPSKQQKIIFMAQRFCLQHHLRDVIIRFDVALVEPHHVTYIENAFV